MIYLGRNLPSVLISLKEMVTKIASGRSKINHVVVYSGFLIPSPHPKPLSYPSVCVRNFLSPYPTANHGDIPTWVVIGTIVGRLLILSWKSHSQLSQADCFPKVGKKSYLVGREEAS